MYDVCVCFVRVIVIARAKAPPPEMSVKNKTARQYVTGDESKPRNNTKTRVVAQMPILSIA